MRTPLRLVAGSVAAATLVVTAAGATAEPIDSAPAPARVAQAAPGTGSSALDTGSTAANTAVWYIQHGDVIGMLLLLAGTPFVALTSGVCDLITLSGFRSPCATATK